MILTLKEAFFNEKSLLDEEEIEKDENIIITPSDEQLMNAMETGIERAIANSVSLEEAAFSKNDQKGQIINEKAAIGGFEYEKKVINALRKAKATGNIRKGAGASNTVADADINIFGKIFNVECKLNANAQMGGGSVRYSKGTEPSIVEKKGQKLEPETASLLIETIKGKAGNINRLLDFLKKQAPEIINQKIIKFPLICTKDAWLDASEKGLLVFASPEFDTSFISNHYAKKKVYYIQIGGSGLFYLKKNPAKLPVPKLDGKIAVEIRTGRDGGRRLSSGIKVLGAGLRAQGKLRTKNKSPYTLDDPKSIREMITAIGRKKKGKKTK